MLGRCPVVLWGVSNPKVRSISIEARAPCPHPSTKLREVISWDHCLLSNLAWQYTLITLVSTVGRRYSCTWHPYQNVVWKEKCEVFKAFESRPPVSQRWVSGWCRGSTRSKRKALKMLLFFFFKAGVSNPIA